MESEKVKEIKKALEDNATREHYNSLWYMDDCKCITVFYADILTLINELESENERLENENYKLEQNLGQCENGYELELHTARCQVYFMEETVEKLKKENEILRNAKVVYETVDYCAEDLRKAQDRIAELEKENKSLYDSYHKGYKVGYEYGKQDAISCEKAESDSRTNETTQSDYKLKQFVEKFKEKCIRAGIFPAFVANELKETLKEFIK